MGSEADAETKAANAVDSDGSDSWEDFFGEFLLFFFLHFLYCTLSRKNVICGTIYSDVSA